MKIYRLNPAEFRSWRDRALRIELMNKIHAEHGIAQVRAPSGVILGTARGVTERIPIERARIRGAHHAVSPGECVCREWQKPEGKQDEHHPICRLKSAWEAQLAHSPDVPRERALTTNSTGMRQTADEAVPSAREQLPAALELAPPEAPAEPEPSPIPAQHQTSAVPAPAPDPNDCICREWSGTEDDKHHRICEFRERWEREHNIAVPVLVELETGTVAREATADEADASKANEDQDGLGTIELSDGRLYYVRQP